MIDTHVHILDPARFPYPARTKGYLPKDDEAGTLDDLLRVMAAHRIDRAVLVQPSVYGADNAALLDGLTRHPDRFRGVVMADDPSTVANLAQIAGVAGLRLNLTDYSADNAVALGQAALDAGLVLHLQARPPAATRVLAQLGAGPVILDHLGLPDMTQPDDLLQLYKLAKRNATFLKISGGFRLGAGAWPIAGQELRDLLAAFGRDQIIWGSDWPFINLASTMPTYAQCLSWVRDLMLDPAVTTQTAKRLFKWPAT